MTTLAEQSSNTFNRVMRNHGSVRVIVNLECGWLALLRQAGAVFKDLNQPSDMTTQASTPSAKQALNGQTIRSAKTPKVQRGAQTQAPPNEVQMSFNEHMRAIMRQAAEQMMHEEVSALCGAKYHPCQQARYYRAGSERGVLRTGLDKQEVRRPRVRRADGAGEVLLQSYQQMRKVTNHEEVIAQMVGEGLSCRGFSRATEGALGKSSIAEQWARKGAEHLEALRSVDLSQTHWAVLMVDGLFLHANLCAVVAVGVDAAGRKHVLDFETAASETTLCTQRLLTRLVERGFSPPASQRLLALCDGSKALQKALKTQWPDCLLQECLVHVQRHVCDRLRRTDRAECMRLFERLRVASGAAAAQEAYDDLHKWLGTRHEGAQQSVEDAKERILAVHGMELGEQLQRSLLSTNAIENVMRNLRQQTHGVKRWRDEGPMAERWLASGLRWVGRGLHPLRGHAAMPRLIEALRKPEEAAPGEGGATAKRGLSFQARRSAPPLPLQTPFCGTSVLPNSTLTTNP